MIAARLIGYKWLSGDKQKEEKKDSLGISNALLWPLFNTCLSLKGCARSCWNLKNPPVRELDELEVAFAKNQCFIPKTLWNKIITEFMLARPIQ